MTNNNSSDVKRIWLPSTDEAEKLKDEQVSKLWKSSDEIQAWFESIRPIHQMGTFTFYRDMPQYRAIAEYRTFWDELARIRKEHIFLVYCWGNQPLRTATPHRGTHLHCLIAYEGYIHSKPNNAFLEAKWNLKHGIRWQDKTKAKACLIEGYDNKKRGVNYTVLKHNYDNWDFYVACPHNQHRCNGKDRVCWFEESAERWRAD